MAETRFEGTGPVARYWLARCQGFAVRGGAHGTVEQLIRGADPHATEQLVVRTRSRRVRTVPVEAVASVDPTARVVFVEAAPASPPRLAPAARRARTAAAPHARTAAHHSRAAAKRVRSTAVTGARAAAPHARTAARTSGTALQTIYTALAPRVTAAARIAARFLHAALLVLADSFRMLGAELRPSRSRRSRRTSRPRGARAATPVARRR